MGRRERVEGKTGIMKEPRYMDLLSISGCNRCEEIEKNTH